MIKKIILLIIPLISYSLDNESINFPPDQSIAARIDKYRKKSIIIVCKDENGTPIKSGSIAIIEQQKHDFLFGSNIFKFNKCKTENQNIAYASYFSEIFNFATLPFYWWGETENPKRIDKPWREEVIKWCHSQSITIKGHPLAWNWEDPSWLPQEANTAYKLQMDRIEKIIHQYKEDIIIWDVINEATAYDRKYPLLNAPVLTEAIHQKGLKQFIIDGFTIARESNPLGIYIINDFKTGRKFKTKVLDPLAMNGKPLFDVIGIQTHMHNGYWGADRVWTLCEKFSEFDTPIHFTEISILSGIKSGNKWESTVQGEIDQAKQVKELYSLLFSNPNVEAITWWDFSDQGTWKNAPSGLLKKDMSPKLAYLTLKKLIKTDWWTRDTLTLNESGQIKLNGFYGEYNIQIQNNNKILKGDFEIKKGETSSIKIELK